MKRNKVINEPTKIKREKENDFWEKLVNNLFIHSVNFCCSIQKFKDFLRAKKLSNIQNNTFASNLIQNSSDKQKPDYLTNMNPNSKKVTKKMYCPLTLVVGSPVYVDNDSCSPEYEEDEADSVFFKPYFDSSSEEEEISSYLFHKTNLENSIYAKKRNMNGKNLSHKKVKTKSSEKIHTLSKEDIVSKLKSVSFVTYEGNKREPVMTLYNDPKTPIKKETIPLTNHEKIKN